jgi:hypothetical protein
MAMVTRAIRAVETPIRTMEMKITEIMATALAVKRVTIKQKRKIRTRVIVDRVGKTKRRIKVMVETVETTMKRAMKTNRKRKNKIL